MTFEEYFRLEGLPKERQYARFLLRLAPKGLHRDYLVDPSRLDLVGTRAPSSAAGVPLSAGIVGGEAATSLLGRGPRRPTTYYPHLRFFKSRSSTRALSQRHEHLP